MVGTGSDPEWSQRCTRLIGPTALQLLQLQLHLCITCYTAALLHHLPGLHYLSLHYCITWPGPTMSNSAQIPIQALDNLPSDTPLPIKLVQICPVLGNTVIGK